MEQREVKWCNTHDIPWASHADLGVVLKGCEPGKRFMVVNIDTGMITDDAETSMVGLPPHDRDMTYADLGVAKPVPQLSTSGYWALGQTYKAIFGECAGHTVTVVNPRLPALRQITFDRDDVRRTLTGMVECVQVRCGECFRSWRFPAAAELPSENTSSPEFQQELADSVFREIVANGGVEGLA